ncbi:MAG: helix-hairpin-helix domain-containing protein [Bacteroidaceae bacterium]|nr:helix-hairpin-helix domain-containing protein [Bacteroidaceae bacterium]
MKKTGKYILALFIILWSFGADRANAQQMTWDDFVERYHPFDDDSRNDILFDELLEIHTNKINFNNTSEQELAQLPFLSSSQIKDILYYIVANGAMVSLGELMYVPSIDKDTRQFLRLFCYAGDTPNKITPSLLLSNIRNEVTARTDIPFYTQEGYKDYQGTSDNKHYEGSRLYHSIRYRLNSMEHLHLGIQAEKDPGEKSIDYMTGYAQIQDIGCIQNAIIGNYRISFGQGLVVNTGTSFGKGMMFGKMDKMDRGITRHSSLTEANYFTGGATTIKCKSFLISAFASYRNIDANINKDGTGITSLKTDGLHRTILEKSKKGNTSVTDIGGNIHWERNSIQLSATMAYTHFSLPLMPKYDTPASLYRFHNAKGNDFLSYSLSYGYKDRKWAFLGETASGNKGGIATLNTIIWNMNPSNTLTLIQRYYSHKYVSINSNAFSENSLPQNEQGIFIGWNSKAIRRTTIDAHLDFYYFPWLKYQVSSSSHGFDGLVQISYTPSKTLDFALRYKMKSKQKDFVFHKSKTDTIKALLYNTSHNLRLSCTYNATDKLSFKTTLNGIMIDFDPNNKEYGYAISEQVQWKSNKTRFNISATYFNTDTYNARIYSYEPSLLYTFGMSSYYYEGFRIIALASIPLTPNLTITSKIGTTHFHNKQTIGPGTQSILSPHKEDLQIQLRLKF